LWRNGITVNEVRHAGRRNFKRARAKIRIKKLNTAHCGYVYVERLVLEEGGKEALEDRLRRELTEEELGTIYQSILKIEQDGNAESVDMMWSRILQQKEKGGLFDEKDLDWIK
jgi:hypothetical protein